MTILYASSMSCSPPYPAAAMHSAQDLSIAVTRLSSAAWSTGLVSRSFGLGAPKPTGAGLGPISAWRTWAAQPFGWASRAASYLARSALGSRSYAVFGTVDSVGAGWVSVVP